MKYANSDEYTGQWDSSQAHGKGVYTFADGEKIDGEFKRGVAFGHCTISYTDGSVYVGSVVSDERDGKGELTTASGDKVYRGSWSKDKKHGPGGGGIADGRRPKAGAPSLLSPCCFCG